MALVVVFFMPESNQAPVLERWRDNLLIKASLAAGILAMAAAGASIKSSSAEASSAYAPALQEVGFTTSEMFTDDKQAAEDAAQKIQDSGANTVRIPVPYTTGNGGQAEIKNDKEEYCNAGQSAVDHNLHVIWALDGYGPSQKPGSNGKVELGHVPESPSQNRRLGTTLATIMWTLAKKPDANGQNGGCAPGFNTFDFEIFNEENSPTFNQNQDSTTPYKYMTTLSKVYPVVKDNAAKLGVTGNVIAGAFSSSHNPGGFVAGMAQAKKDLKISFTPFDKISWHPYPTPADSSPVSTERAMYKTIKPIDDNSFDSVPILLDEVGINSNPPQEKRQYYGRQILSALSVSEQKQAQYYSDFYSEAACEPGVIGAMTFELTDDGKNWSSGVYYKDGTPKPTISFMHDTMTSALDGTLTSCG